MRTLPALLPLCLTVACAHSPELEVHSWTSADAGFHTNSQWVETADGVVVVDAQFTPATASALLEAIREETDAPITHVLVTHPNPDKYMGASVFQAEGASLVMSEATASALPGVDAYKKAYFVGAGAFTETTWPGAPTPDEVFADRWTHPSADIQAIRLEHSGVTGTQTVVLLGDDAVAVGDLVSNRTHAWLEGDVSTGSTKVDLAAWDAALVELSEVAAGRSVHPGRGPTLATSVAVDEQRAYLVKADQIVADYLAELDSPSDVFGDDAAAHTEALTQRFVDAFPEQAHPYLVSYGAYGLVIDHLPE